MRKYVMIALLASCSRRPPPPPEPAIGDAAQALPKPVDAAEIAHPYRTADSVTQVDPEVVGTGATYMVA